jgi:hypothetical protein
MIRPAERVTLAFLVCLWLVCAWRAATQSIVHDEAFTYQYFIAGPVSAIFNEFSANHHFLNTVLIRIATSIGGVSEFTMRLPALLGAVLYFTGVYRFTRWGFGSGWMLPLIAAALTLNPLVLDFMVAARGYGFALGLWMLSLALLGPELATRTAFDRRNVALAGTLAALAVTANLVFVLPVFALAGLVLWKGRGQPVTAAPAKKRAPAPRVRPLWLYFLVPAAAIGVLFLLLAPLEAAKGEDFYAGSESLADSLRNLATASLEHGGPEVYRAAVSRVRDAIAFVIAPLILAAAAVVGVWRGNLPLLLGTFPAVFAGAMTILLHVVRGVPYPVDRTGIYFLPAVVIGVAGLAHLAPRAGRIAGMAVLGIAIAAFLVQFNTRKFFVWPYDAESREIAGQVAGYMRNGHKVAYSWQLEPALNFYRGKNGWTSLPPFDRMQITPGYDYYVLIYEDRGMLSTLGLTPMYEGPVSHTVIAKNSPASR